MILERNISNKNLSIFNVESNYLFLESHFKDVFHIFSKISEIQL